MRGVPHDTGAAVDVHPSRSTIDMVREAVAATLCIPVETVSPDVDIVDDLGAGSLDMIEIGMAVEAHARVDRISDADLAGVLTPAKLAAVVERRMAEAAEARR